MLAAVRASYCQRTCTCATATARVRRQCVVVRALVDVLDVRRRPAARTRQLQRGPRHHHGLLLLVVVVQGCSRRLAELVATVLVEVVVAGQPHVAVLRPAAVLAVVAAGERLLPLRRRRRFPASRWLVRQESRRDVRGHVTGRTSGAGHRRTLSPRSTATSQQPSRYNNFLFYIH